MMKYLKNNNKGFTLVEVIVVAVIVLVLAAVAIPLYQGYVNQAREGTATNIAATIAKTAGTALALGHYANPAAADAAINGATASGSFMVSSTADSIGVMWDADKWAVSSSAGCVTVTSKSPVGTNGYARFHGSGSCPAGS